MSARRIVGICLVRDEELFVERAVRNASALCDEWILVDHASRDGTPEILRRLERELPQARFHAIRHPAESHALIRHLAGTPTWVFGVDGDEIYDPAGLAAFRVRLLAGEFDAHWMILGNALHTTRLDMGDFTATGHLAPPSRSITKLYNFAAIHSWSGDSVERLHGGTPVFRAGFDADAKCHLHARHAWDDAPLRCLHLCFVRRSGLDAGETAIRENIDEIYNASPAARILRWLRSLGGQKPDSVWKQARYRRGAEETVDTRAFFRS